MKSFQMSEVKMLHYSLRLLEFLKRFDFWTYSTSIITNFLFHLLISQVVFYFVDSYMQWHCNNALLILLKKMDSEAFLSLLHCVLISCPHSPNPDGQGLLPDAPVYDGGGERFACQDSVDD